MHAVLPALAQINFSCHGGPPRQNRLASQTGEPASRRNQGIAAHQKGSVSRPPVMAQGFELQSPLVSPFTALPAPEPAFVELWLAGWYSAMLVDEPVGRAAHSKGCDRATITCAKVAHAYQHSGPEPRNLAAQNLGGRPIRTQEQPSQHASAPARVPKACTSHSCRMLAEGDAPLVTCS
jgi:hypothetical protein